jgi:hypothetical protein
MLRVSNRNILESTQQFITWDQNRTAKFYLSFSQDEIKIKVNNLSQNILSIQRFMDAPAFLVIGDSDCTLGTSIKYLSSISYTENSLNEEDLTCYMIDLNSRAI